MEHGELVAPGRRGWRGRRGLVWLSSVALVALMGCGGGSAPGQPGEGSTLDDYGAGGGSPSRRIGSAILRYAGDQLVSAAVGGVAGIAMDAALNAIFSGDTDAIGEGMDECNRKLDLVIDKLNEISAQLDNALTAIQESRDDIEALNNELAIKEPIDIINSDYRNLEQLSRWASDDDPRNDPTPADAEELANTIRSTAKHDIPLQLDRMHTGIVGGTGSGRGALREWTDRIRNGIRAGDDLWDAYLTLENYFCELLTIQTKGLLLIANAYEMDSARGGRYVGTAESYRDEVFYPHTEAQLKLFLELAEGLIADQCRPNRQTFLIHAKIPEMYNRMDWIAAQVSEFWNTRFTGPKYSYGLHVHVWTDGNKCGPRSSSAAWDAYPCDVYYGPVGVNDKLAFDPAWGGRRLRNYETETFIDLMLLDDGDNPSVVAFDRSVSVKVWSYYRPEFESRQIHIQHPLVDPEYVDWVRDVTRKDYNGDFEAVAAGTEGSHPHCTVVVDYRILEVPIQWQVNTTETNTSASGWTVTRLWPEDQVVNEFWCGLRAVPTSNNSANKSIGLRLDSRFRVGNLYDKKNVRVEWQAKISRRQDVTTSNNPLFWFKYGWAQEVTSTNWATYTQQVNDILAGEDNLFRLGMKVACQTKGATTVSSAKTGEFEVRVRNLRLSMP